MTLGYGGIPWGGGPYGAGTELLKLLSAVPFSENVVRLTFSQSVLFTGLADPNDGGSRHRYAISASGNDGDGNPARPVFVAKVAPGPSATTVDLTLDRHLSSWPAAYSVAVSALVSVSGLPLDGSSTSASFGGLAYDEPDRTTRSPAAGGDVANPQTVAESVVGAAPGQSSVLGSYPVSAAGDYATDSGVASWKKRIFRRLLARKGGFAALGEDYGLGAVDEVKKLLRAGLATRLAARAQAQVLADPETKSATVALDRVLQAEGVAWLVVDATRITGERITAQKVRVG